MYGHEYDIVVTRTAEHTWSAEVQDKDSGNSTHIGSWTLPEGTGGITPTGNGFIEYFAHYESGYPQFTVPACSKLAKIDITLGIVTTNSLGGGIGSVTEPYEYGSDACNGPSSGFSSQSITIPSPLPDGSVVDAQAIRVSRGFISSVN